jgi:hypothetical protein
MAVDLLAPPRATPGGVRQTKLSLSDCWEALTTGCSGPSNDTRTSAGLIDHQHGLVLLRLDTRGVANGSAFNPCYGRPPIMEWRVSVAREYLLSGVRGLLCRNGPGRGGTIAVSGHSCRGSPKRGT